MQKLRIYREKGDKRVTDERENPGVIAPPPLIYLVPLVLGLLLKRTFPIPFLPPRATRVLGWHALASSR